MAKAIVGATVDVLLQNLIAFSVEEIGIIWNFTDDLKSLKDSVATIRDFLEDAEMRQVTDKPVQRWLVKLEAVAFDADSERSKVSHIPHVYVNGNTWIDRR